MVQTKIFLRSNIIYFYFVYFLQLVCELDEVERYDIAKAGKSMIEIFTKDNEDFSIYIDSIKKTTKTRIQLDDIVKSSDLEICCLNKDHIFIGFPHLDIRSNSNFLYIDNEIKGKYNLTMDDTGGKPQIKICDHITFNTDAVYDKNSTLTFFVFFKNNDIERTKHFQEFISDVNEMCLYLNDIKKNISLVISDDFKNKLSESRKKIVKFIKFLSDIEYDLKCIGLCKILSDSIEKCLFKLLLRIQVIKRLYFDEFKIPISNNNHPESFDYLSSLFSKISCDDKDDIIEKTNTIVNIIGKLSDDMKRIEKLYFLDIEVRMLNINIKDTVSYYSEKIKIKKFKLDRFIVDNKNFIIRVYFTDSSYKFKKLFFGFFNYKNGEKMYFKDSSSAIISNIYNDDENKLKSDFKLTISENIEQFKKVCDNNCYVYIYDIIEREMVFFNVYEDGDKVLSNS